MSKDLIELTAPELLSWNDPQIAEYAERLAHNQSQLAAIKNRRGPAAEYARDFFTAHSAELEASIASAQSLNSERAALASAIDACAVAQRAFEAATEEEASIAAEVTLARARRAASKARDEFLAAARAGALPFLPTRPRPSEVQAFEGTRALAALAAAIAADEARRETFGVEPAGAAKRLREAIAEAETQGRAATPEVLRYFAAEQIAFPDPVATKLFNVRWLTACGKLELPRDRELLDLPKSMSEHGAMAWI